MSVLSKCVNVIKNTTAMLSQYLITIAFSPIVWPILKIISPSSALCDLQFTEHRVQQVGQQISWINERHTPEFHAIIFFHHYMQPSSLACWWEVGRLTGWKQSTGDRKFFPLFVHQEWWCRVCSWDKLWNGMITNNNEIDSLQYWNGLLQWIRNATLVCSMMQESQQQQHLWAQWFLTRWCAWYAR